MKKVLLYWNHICILHNFEKKYLKELQEKLIKEEIELEVRFFGLGYEEHMSEYLARKDAILPDIIVSADLEVYENKVLYNKLGNLYNTKEWMELKSDILTTACIRKSTLLPVVAIPLVCYTTSLQECKEKSILSMNTDFAFGGINNSAGKTIAKAVWEMYGNQSVQKLLESSKIYDMPIGAFQSVRTGINKTCLVPSLYALRADNDKSFATLFSEGEFILPSYCTCRTSIDEEIGKQIVRSLFSKELLEIYSDNGDLHICLKSNLKKNREISKFCCVSQKFLDELDDEIFYDIYTQYIPTANKLLDI